ncbi:SDR family NAD(P)-dependent oxidoreductase [Segnochrobactrum spirostomi]
MAGAKARHPLLGYRLADGSPEWRSLLDARLVPWLNDHKVDGSTVVPASGLVDMVLTVGASIYGDEVALEIDDFDISKALVVSEDETREVSTRWFEQSEIVEIRSRKRFAPAEGDWLLHARGRVSKTRRSRNLPLAPPIVAEKVRNTAEEVYAEALRAGLDYGPRFRLVSHIERDHVTTDALLAHADVGLGGEFGFVLHPASFDAALHGLFISRPQKDGETKAYMPVRIRKLCVWDRGADIRRSISLLTQESDRFKTVAITLMTEDGVVVAAVEAVVLRSVYLSKATISDRTFHREIVPLVRPDLRTALADIRTRLRQARDAALPPQWLLVRAFCVSLAHQIFTRLTEDGAALSPNQLVASGRVSAKARAYVEVMYDVMSEFETSAGPGNQTRSRAAMNFPTPEALLATLTQRFPAANIEIRLCSKALEYAEETVRTGQFPPTSDWLVRTLESESVLTAPVVEAIADALRKLAERAGKQLRVLALEPFGAGLIDAFASLAETGKIEVTFASKDATALDQVRSHFGTEALVDYLLVTPEMGGQPIPFDACVAFATSELAREDANTLEQLVALLHSNAPVIIGIPGAEPAFDMLCGLWESWLKLLPSGAYQGRTPHPDSVARRLRKAGVEDIEVLAARSGLGRLVVGNAPASRQSEGGFGAITGPVVVVTENERDSRATMLRSFVQVLATGPDPAGALSPWLKSAPAGEMPTFVVLAHALGDAPTEQLTQRIAYLTALLKVLDLARREVRLFVITEGAYDPTSDNAPVEAGVWGFVRVAINEYPGIDIRLIDVQAGGQIEDIAKVVSLPGDEREWIIGANGAAANRMRRGIERPVEITAEERSVLRFDQPGRLDSFVWEIEPRVAVPAGSIEIEVAAVGLNFRDILVGLGILDDDLLGAGLTAASLGFECSGTVVGVGEGVERFAVGDGVMGFASNAFATHLVAPEWQFFVVPGGVSLEAAASIPVAFATAWYALVDRAQLKAGEDVLIHGGAGGVGLAAIHIAKRIGARILATASDRTRRRVALSAGADLVFESRHERFATPIAQTVGGVDVVLNSLAGPGMLASFGLVKPFGRFIELGKRDYLENSPLGLRPFVRNLSYSGVDLDELLAHNRVAVQGLMKEISDGLQRNELKALPHRIYEGHEVARAFRSMQASEHLGKIVVRPSRHARRDMPAGAFNAAPGVYLIAGGTAGFGFRTACWLAEKGATTLVLASRRGRIEEGSEAEVAKLRKRGVKVIIEALDVTDLAATRALVDDVVREHGPIRGVVHAAVHLDDGLIKSLEPASLRKSLAAKTEGALNLEAATDAQPLDFFVLYSSATTMIGSPGQGAYVAANAFLEGLARKRRALGKPALSIGWGAISDAGIIARDRQLGERLRRTTGVVGIRSSELLAHLGRLLALGDRADPTQFYTNVASGGVAGKLALLNTPAFTGLGIARRADVGEDSGDLATAIAGRPREDAITVIAGHLRREVATILRMNEAHVDPNLPLGDMGLDSLMALELHVGIERLAGVQIPTVGISNRRLMDVAMLIHDQLSGGEPTSTLDETGVEIIQLLSAHTTNEVAVEKVGELQRRLRTASAGGPA